MYYVHEQMVYKCGRISQGAVGSVSRCALCAIAVIIRHDVRMLFLYLRRRKDRCNRLLSVKQQRCISDMTQRKEWVHVLHTVMPVKSVSPLTGCRCYHGAVMPHEKLAGRGQFSSSRYHGKALY